MSNTVVLHVISGGMFGGGQKVVADLIENLPKAGNIRVELCLLQADNEHFSSFPRTIVGYAGNYRNPWITIPAARRLAIVIREVKPDIVHSHGYDAELISAFACGWTGSLHISHLHDTPQWVRSCKARHRLRRLYVRAITTWAKSYWIACAEAVRQLAINRLRYSPDRIFTVRNCIATESFTHLPIEKEKSWQDGPFTIGSVGRLAKTKGFQYLIQAIHCLVEEGVNIKLMIAGDGPDREYFKRLIDNGVGRDAMTLLGWVHPISKLYSEIDVFCLPSSSEGLPLVILEAMASGLPVIATDVMGSCEVVQNGQTGILVPPEDVESLRLAILSLYNDPRGRVQMAHRARQFVLENHRLENMLREISAVYFNLTRQPEV